MWRKQWAYFIGHCLSLFFIVLISFYSIGKFVINNSTLTARMTFRLLGSFHKRDEQSRAEFSLLFDDDNYLYSILTFALHNYFVTGSKSYSSQFSNGIGSMWSVNKCRSKKWESIVSKIYNYIKIIQNCIQCYRNIRQRNIKETV